MKLKRFSMLESYRKKYGITQSNMAEMLETCVSNYANKEKGKTQFFLDEMIKILKYINQEAEKVGDKQLAMEDIFLQ